MSNRRWWESSWAESIAIVIVGPAVALGLIYLVLGRSGIWD